MLTRVRRMIEQLKQKRKRIHRGIHGAKLRKKKPKTQKVSGSLTTSKSLISAEVLWDADGESGPGQSGATQSLAAVEVKRAIILDKRSSKK